MSKTAPSRPKLLILTSTLPRWAGDSEPRFVLDLAHALSDRFACTILAPQAVGAARREWLDGVAIVRFPYAPIARWQTLAAPGAIMPNLRKHPLLYALVPALIISQFFALLRMLKRDRFDLVHSHWLVPQGLVLALAGLFVRVPPTLVTCHGADAFTLEFPPLARLKRWALRKADAATVVSRDIAAHLAQAVKTPLVLIPMGVDLQRFAMRDRLSGPDRTILFAGRLAAKKGVDHLIRAMADRRLRDRGATLQIIGNGPLREELEQLARTLGVAPQVSFRGSLPHAELARAMQAATIFCAPFVVGTDGDREGTPTILLEAAASGIPIVTSDVGGCGDIIRAGHSGWLLPPGDEEALASALVEALDNPDRARTMALNARQCAEDHAWPRIAGRYADLLDKVRKSGKALA
jgi:glycosyltransferase involved in cell wall biosynthesis